MNKQEAKFQDIWDEIKKKANTAYVFTEKRPKMERLSSDNQPPSLCEVRLSVDEAIR